MQSADASLRYPVAVLGAYGNFGSIITRRLADDPSIDVIAIGRNESALRRLADRCRCRIATVDINESRFGDCLRQLQPQLVIHTAGPFQHQDYRVAQATINAGANYVDLADARAFVGSIVRLDQAARAGGVRVAAGASSVPTLAAAVVESLQLDFARIDSIHHGISSSARMPGLATVAAVLDYCGKPFRQWRERQWTNTYGWQSLHAHDFPAPLGRRWMANCDVPDLDVLPACYPGVRSVRFSAGTGLKVTLFGTWLLSWAVRARLLRNAVSLAPLLHRLAIRLERFGDGLSGMFVSVRGEDRIGHPLTRTWEILARNDRGPEIPCMAAVALARKLAAGWRPPPGAGPCVGLLSLDDYLRELRGPAFTIHQHSCST